MMKKSIIILLILTMLVGNMCVFGEEKETQQNISKTIVMTPVPYATTSCSATYLPEKTAIPEETVIPLSKYEFDSVSVSSQIVSGDYPREVYVYGQVSCQGATVIVKVGNERYTAVVDENRSFNIPIGVVAAGTVVETYITYDSAEGNGLIIADSDHEILTVRGINVDRKYTTPKVEPLFTNQMTIKGKGTRSEKAIAVIGKKIYSDQISDKGKFSIKIPKQKLGIEVAVYIGHHKNSDAYPAHVSSRVYITVQLQKATAKKIKAKAKKITGTGYAGSTVKIYKGKKLLSKATCNKKGKYTAKIKKSKLLKKGVQLKLISTAKAKGKLYKSEAIVKVK